ncbi:hypothetical protein [Burkholderia sp. KBS0801]|uniref:hypothetical protein n=1 Tax=Burkholderia sp. KBS0801 TaxID=1179675 RepID=UPI00110EE74D|nr:hypothetical protein [Burkholderia sp. KBS0801]QDW53249.1 hypothetical protein FFI87_023750 [Burkholderia sp. KBS0801]
MAEGGAETGSAHYRRGGSGRRADADCRRWALGVGAAAGFAATLVAVVFLIQMTRQSLPDGGAGGGA